MESMVETTGSNESNETIVQIDDETTQQANEQVVAEACGDADGEIAEGSDDSIGTEADGSIAVDGLLASDESEAEGSDDLDDGDDAAEDDDESSDVDAPSRNGGSILPFPEDLRLEAKIEAIIFASPKPMRATEIFEILLAQEHELQEQQREQQQAGSSSESTQAEQVHVENDGEGDLQSELEEEHEGHSPSEDEENQEDQEEQVDGVDEELSEVEVADAADESEDIVDLVAGEAGLTLRDVQMTLDNLTDHFRDRCGGFHLAYIKRMGYQFQTVPAAATLMEKQFAKRPRPISRAALETLSIIAYRQPCTRAEIEFVRGVDAGSIINTLMERSMIAMVGRKEIPGRPMLFGTTDEFLKTFQLGHVKDLPSLESFQPATDVLKTAFEKLAAGPESTDVEEFIGDEEYSAESASVVEEALIDETVAAAAREMMEDALTEVEEQPRIAGASAFDETAPDLEMEMNDGTDSTASLDFTAGPGDAEPSGELDS